ncbi:MAG: DUF4097 family beta strand repeat protein [Acidobacteriota bacterium]|nr:DUF4097 family beta strand repeat protein [Acidobacteriota bacterium]
MKVSMRAIFALAALLVVLPPVVQAAHADTETVDRTFTFQPGGTVHLKNFSGRVTITASDKPQVVIHAVRNASRDRLDRIKLDIEQSGDEITINANKKVSSGWSFFHDNNVVETDFDIQVPRQTNLDVSVFSSPVTVNGVQGSQQVKGFSSPITLQDATGPVEAHTFSGDIDVRSADWKPGASLDAHTFSGDITLQVPKATHARIQFKTFSGDLHSDLPLVFNSQTHGTVRAELGSGGDDADFTLHTFSGDVRIH